MPLKSAQLVLYDSKGIEEPRVVFGGGADSGVIRAAAREDGGVLRLLVTASSDAENFGGYRYQYSPDGGTSWMQLDIPVDFRPNYSPDRGGPTVRGRGSLIRLGTPQTPFVVSGYSSISNRIEIHAIDADGKARMLASVADDSGYDTGRVIGSNRDGSEMLVAGNAGSGAGIYRLRLDGTITKEIDLDSTDWMFEGWITPQGAIYLESTYYTDGLDYRISVVEDHVRTNVVLFPTDQTFAVPTADFSGAWIVQTRSGAPTSLWSHHPGGAVIEHWRDDRAPQVEAVHAAASGSRLLLQVHRPRQQPDQFFITDPALAIWEIGAPPPSHYDELFLNEGGARAFVHLDVDEMARGGSFIFDSAAVSGCNCPPPQISSGGGGADVPQEWGVVRASLRQTLVINGVGRLPGAYGSVWRSDVIVENPLDQPLPVDVRLVSTNGARSDLLASIVLAPKEVRVIRDVLSTLFGLQNGSGSLFLTPQHDAISAFVRTYSLRADGGTYGMGIWASDIESATTPRFRLTFAAALQGEQFRTNLVLADTAQKGAAVRLSVAGNEGLAAEQGEEISVAPGGQTQLSGIAPALGLPPYRSGAVVAEATRGSMMTSVVAIDNRTNDPTVFPPDLPAPTFRTIPALAHVDGANGAHFRSDLFLYNAAEVPHNVSLFTKRWDVNEPEARVDLTMLPHESKIVRDALVTLFGKSGVARLRFISQSTDPEAVRVTSRLYTLGSDGGTYGLVMPPFNSFQSIGRGETLQILGALRDASFRLNLSIVDLGASFNGSPIRVRIEIQDATQSAIDAFETVVPRAGGVQLVDLLRARGIPLDGTAALIRVSLLDPAVVAAFASDIDNRSNDPMLLAAALEESE